MPGKDRFLAFGSLFWAGTEGSPGAIGSFEGGWAGTEGSPGAVGRLEGGWAGTEGGLGAVRGLEDGFWAGAAGWLWALGSL